MIQPTIDKEGYFYYRCSICHKPKMACLFTPSELVAECRCRVCIGETNKGRYGQKHKPSLDQLPKMAGLA